MMWARDPADDDDAPDEGEALAPTHVRRLKVTLPLGLVLSW